MQKRQSNYERVLLALMALLAIGVAAWLIYLKMGFAETLIAPVVNSRNEMAPPALAKVQDAIKRVTDTPKPWDAPRRNNKNVPLNKSVLLALKGEDVIDMALEITPIRPPMTNAFLREHNLEWERSNVGELDPDDDGFTNIEEFVANPQTNPKDAKSHPPVTDKLFLAERISKDYRLVLRNSTGQLNLPDETGRNKKNYFLDLTKVGVPTEQPQFFGGNGDRFKAVKWEVKKVPDPKLGERDVSELTIEEIVSKNNIVLVMNVEKNLAEYSVKFVFRLKQVIELAPVGKDGSFRIPGYEDTTYKVIDIQEDKAIISPLDAGGKPGPEILIKRG